MSSTYLVFSQDPSWSPDFSRLAAQAEKFFACRLELVERAGARAKVKLVSSRPAFSAELTVHVREVTHEDLANARDAEARGRAAGMGALAERCKIVWEVAAGPSDATGVLTLCAICASVALGPVLPPDHATLFGVRGAIERRDSEASRDPTSK